MSFSRARQIADAVLLEGYLLYPYRASATKNQFRWAFGVLAPKEWSEGGGCEPWWMETQCLLSADDSATVEGRLRFLQIEERKVEALRPDGSFEGVRSLDVGAKRWISWEEGDVNEIEFEHPLSAGEAIIPVRLPKEEAVELLRDGGGAVVGRIVRTRQPLEARLHLRVERVSSEEPLFKLTARAENAGRSDDPRCGREEILRRSCISSHFLLRLHGGTFLSAVDPPSWAKEASAGCKSVRAHPVLIGDDGHPDDIVLASPIILYDHPKIAPESPGDFFDGCEIDELLTLRTSTLTDAEKAEARATDPRAAAIVDRVEALPPESWAQLHGTFRDLRREEMVPTAEQLARAALERGGPLLGAESGWDEPPPMGVALVDPAPGDPARLGELEALFPKGSLVRLLPGRRRADAQDLLYAGKYAKVEKVVLDLDGRELLGVTVVGDPAAEMHRWYGRFHYYEIDEVERVPEDDREPDRGAAT